MAYAALGSDTGLYNQSHSDRKKITPGEAALSMSSDLSYMTWREEGCPPGHVHPSLPLRTGSAQTKQAGAPSPPDRNWTGSGGTLLVNRQTHSRRLRMWAIIISLLHSVYLIHGVKLVPLVLFCKRSGIKTRKSSCVNSRLGAGYPTPS